jgi:hypothetical protein
MSKRSAVTYRTSFWVLIILRLDVTCSTRRRRGKPQFRFPAAVEGEDTQGSDLDVKRTA